MKKLKLNYLFLATLISCSQAPVLRQVASEKESASVQDCNVVLEKALSNTSPKSIDELMKDVRLQKYQGKFSKRSVQMLKEMNDESGDIVDDMMKAFLISEEYSELIQSKIVFYALAEVIASKSANLAEAKNLIEALVLPLTHGKGKRDYMEAVRLWITDFLVKDGNPESFKSFSISDRLKLLDMNKEDYVNFAVFWGEVITGDPKSFEDSLVVQMTDNGQLFIDNVMSELKKKKRTMFGFGNFKNKPPFSWREFLGIRTWKPIDLIDTLEEIKSLFHATKSDVAFTRHDSEYQINFYLDLIKSSTRLASQSERAAGIMYILSGLNILGKIDERIVVIEKTRLIILESEQKIADDDIEMIKKFIFDITKALRAQHPYYEATISKSLNSPWK